MWWKIHDFELHFYLRWYILKAIKTGSIPRCLQLIRVGLLVAALSSPQICSLSLSCVQHWMVEFVSLDLTSLLNVPCCHFVHFDLGHRNAHLNFRWIISFKVGWHRNPGTCLCRPSPQSGANILQNFGLLSHIHREMICINNFNKFCLAALAYLMPPKIHGGPSANLRTTSALKWSIIMVPFNCHELKSLLYKWCHYCSSLL